MDNPFTPLLQFFRNGAPKVKVGLHPEDSVLEKILKQKIIVHGVEKGIQKTRSGICFAPSNCGFYIISQEGGQTSVVWNYPDLANRLGGGQLGENAAEYAADSYFKVSAIQLDDGTLVYGDSSAIPVKKYIRQYEQLELSI